MSALPDGVTESSSRPLRILQAVHDAIPYLVTLVVVGLGHLYERQWRRGLAWFGLYVFTLTFLSGYVPESDRSVLDIFLVHALTAPDPFHIAFPAAIMTLALLDLYLLRLAERSHSLGIPQ